LKATFRETFDKSFWIFAVAALVTGTACYLAFGAEAFGASIAEDATLVGFLIPKLGAAVLIAAFVQVLLPPSFFSRYMGHEAGLKGMVIASAAGTVTPGGPMTSFPLVTLLRDGGTGIGALVTYVTAWAANGLQRVFMWELPLMGAEFAIVRFLASMPLGIIAGLLARLFPAQLLPGQVKRARE
jgi:uncharacterized membrane protein YraQ (UPF0718 family)